MITVITNFYLSDNEKRQCELNDCLSYNISNLSITQHIILCNKEAYDYINENFDFGNAKTVFIIGEGRPTYNDFFQLSNRYAINEIRVLLNSDIFIPHSSSHHFNQIKEGVVWALSRYEGLHGKLWNHRDSQDVWAWIGNMVEIEDADFGLGVAGCDNRIAYLFNCEGYAVLNPSIDVKTIHLHASNHRTYNPKEAIKPPYHFIQPHKLSI